MVQNSKNTVPDIRDDQAVDNEDRCIVSLTREALPGAWDTSPNTTVFATVFPTALGTVRSEQPPG